MSDVLQLMADILRRESRFIAYLLEDQSKRRLWCGFSVAPEGLSDKTTVTSIGTV
jgi:hypothetical protein